MSTVQQIGTAAANLSVLAVTAFYLFLLYKVLAPIWSDPDFSWKLLAARLLSLLIVGYLAISYGPGLLDDLYGAMKVKAADSAIRQDLVGWVGAPPGTAAPSTASQKVAAVPTGIVQLSNNIGQHLAVPTVAATLAPTSTPIPTPTPFTIAGASIEEMRQLQQLELRMQNSESLAGGDLIALKTMAENLQRSQTQTVREAAGRYLLSIDRETARVQGEEKARLAREQAQAQAEANVRSQLETRKMDIARKFDLAQVGLASAGSMASFRATAKGLGLEKPLCFKQTGPKYSVYINAESYLAANGMTSRDLSLQSREIPVNPEWLSSLWGFSQGSFLGGRVMPETGLCYPLAGTN
jgi:hypothetical protein